MGLEKILKLWDIARPLLNTPLVLVRGHSATGILKVL